MKYIFLSILTFWLSSCADFSKNQYVSEYENFVTDLSGKYASYDEKSRLAAEEKFKQFSEVEYKKYEANMTADEKTKVNNLTGKCYAIMAKQKATQITKEFENLLDKTKGVLEELNK